MKRWDYLHFDRAVKRNKLRKIWGDTLFIMNEKETEKYVNDKYRVAKTAFARLMNSASNNGRMEYQLWSIAKVLKLKKNKAN